MQQRGVYLEAATLLQIRWFVTAGMRVANYEESIRVKFSMETTMETRFSREN